VLRLPALSRHRLIMGAGVHLLVDLENVQPSPQEVEVWLGKVDEAWVFYGPDRLKRKAAFEAGSPVPCSGPSKTTIEEWPEYHPHQKKDIPRWWLLARPCETGGRR